MPRVFQNRREAGQVLAGHLRRYANRPDVVVLGLPRGGVPVAYEIARALGAPLDVLVVRKLGVPGHEELAMGAIASGGVRVLNDDVVTYLHIPDALLDSVAVAEQQVLEQRERRYREGRPGLSVRDRTVILVDDGLATGTTMHAAVNALRQLHPHAIIVAVPVIAADSGDALRPLVDDLVWLIAPEPFVAVGRWYSEFAPTSDDEVRDLLAQAAEWSTPMSP